MERRLVVLCPEASEIRHLRFARLTPGGEHVDQRDPVGPHQRHLPRREIATRDDRRERQPLGVAGNGCVLAGWTVRVGRPARVGRLTCSVRLADPGAAREGDTHAAADRAEERPSCGGHD